MFQSILFYALFLVCVPGEKFDPKKVDYCKKKCPFETPIMSSGCNCELRGTRSETDLDKYMEFRKVVIDEHNYLRNFYASGKETKGSSKAVADMLVMNYDVELEYLARCYGRSTFDGYHDDCRMLHDDRLTAQNLGGLRFKNNSLSLIKIHVEDWYSEVKDMEPDMYEKFRLRNDKIMTGHFAAMCWGSANTVGCARIYTSDTIKDKFTKPTMVQALICNYSAKGVKGIVEGADERMFIQGPPCSKCPPAFSKCNSKYTSLCGELEPIPTDEPYDFDNPNGKPRDKPRGKPSNSSKICGKSTILILASVLSMFF